MISQKRGNFISFEGIDSVGKTGHVARLADELTGHGNGIVVTKDPPESEPWDALREQFQRGEKIARIADSHLFLAGTLDNYHRVIVPALEGGQDVLADRSLDSWLVYQSVRLSEHFGSTQGALDYLLDFQGQLVNNGLFTPPDKTIWIADDPSVAMRRSEAVGKSSKFENLAMQERVATQYEALANVFPDRIVRVDINGRDEQQVYQDIHAHVLGALALDHVEPQ
ncbi:MAG TPA: dTMP kinase [Candidatus Saccharimonadales bacterium]|jgi:dTMP kinase|nr:dTMP kinase [Candidatus Saccharimonadales bacterium]